MLRTSSTPPFPPSSRGGVTPPFPPFSRGGVTPPFPPFSRGGVRPPFPPFSRGGWGGGVTKIGVPHALPTFGARHASFPFAFSSTTKALLSALALLTRKFL